MDTFVILVSQLLTLWVMLCGLMFLTGSLVGKPMKYVGPMNKWLVNTIRNLLAGILQIVVNVVKPASSKKKKRRR